MPDVKTVFLGALGLLILATLVFTLRSSTPAFGLIDTQKIISVHAKALASHYPKGAVPQAKLQEVTDTLREDIHLWSRQHKTILLAKGAVWGGDLPDYTDVFTKGEQ